MDSHPGVELYKLGIGNTTEAIVPSVIEGLRKGVEKLSKRKTYTGYGDEQGDTRLRQAISKWYAERGADIDSSEVFVSDGAKSDCANITAIFSDDAAVAISDPGYPVHREASIISGKRVVSMECPEKNNFMPRMPKEKVDLLYICSPNNPTGTAATKKQLRSYVAYARKHKAIIIFDAAYSEYIGDPKLPRSIYEIKGAKSCAIEIQSLSKAAGFTGVRLGWTIVPQELQTFDSGEGMLNRFWNRRQTTMFNGASNIAQEGALAVLSAQGQRQTHKQVAYYMENARIIREGLSAARMTIFGGVDAPYIWLKVPDGLSSWGFFDLLLAKAHVIATPGVVFGENGEGYMRLSAFGHREDIERAVRSIRKNFGAIPIKRS